MSGQVGFLSGLEGGTGLLVAYTTHFWILRVWDKAESGHYLFFLSSWRMEQRFGLFRVH